MHQNVFVGRALPRSSLGEFIALPRFPCWISGGPFVGRGREKGRAKKGVLPAVHQGDKKQLVNYHS